MVFNGVLVLSVAHISADLWQYLACFAHRISSEDMLDLVLCFPLQQLGRLALEFWNLLCLTPPSGSSYYNYSYNNDSTSDSDSTNTDYEHNDRYFYASHSD